MTAAIRRITVVRNGHIEIEVEFDVDSSGRPAFETPREQMQARNAARLRWQDIVDLMLAGQRETGSGRVVPAAETLAR